jgi:hypothetical protein
MSLSQAWVSSGKLSFGTGVWLIHSVLAVLIVLLFWRRMRVGGVWGLNAFLRGLMRKRSNGAVTE